MPAAPVPEAHDVITFLQYLYNIIIILKTIRIECLVKINILLTKPQQTTGHKKNSITNNRSRILNSPRTNLKCDFEMIHFIFQIN